MAFYFGEDFDEITGVRGSAQMMLENMFDEGEDEILPHEDGIFLRDEDLRLHWQRMQKKYPQKYKPTDHIFGTPDGTQHPINTKLMTYFDDDPDKPMRCIVRGSKFVPDDFTDEPMPYYVVRFRGQTQLERTHLDEAHGENCAWKVGWDIEDENEDNDENDAGTDDDRRTQPRLRWLFDDFGGKNLNIDEDLLSSGDITMSKAILEIIRSYVNDGADGAIIANELQTKYQAVEFMEPRKHSMIGTFVDINFAISPDRDRAEEFLRDEKIKFICLPDLIAVKVERHILSCCKGESINDLASGLLIFSGHLKKPSDEDPKPNSDIPNLGNVLEDVDFGVELEFGDAIGMPKKEMSDRLQNYSDLPADLFLQPNTHYDCSKDDKKSGKVEITERDDEIRLLQMNSKNDKSSKGGGNSSNNTKWKLVSDRSLRPKFEYPNSNVLELVSRILRGQEGLDECKHVVKVLTCIAAVQTNESMGLHVHINIGGLSYRSLLNACRTFVEYEDEIDAFMPSSRRSGSKMSDKYFKSNKAQILARRGTTNDEKDSVIDEYFNACKSIDDLCELMNPRGDRYFKLNLQNIRSNRQPTFEFRQHPATTDPKRLPSWIVFCMLLVHRPDRISDYFEGRKDAPASAKSIGEDTLQIRPSVVAQVITHPHNNNTDD